MNRHTENWNNTNLGSLLKNKKEKGHIKEELLSVTRENGIVRRDSLDRRDTSNSDKSKYLLVEKGDIAYNTMRMWQGVSGVSSLRGLVSPAYTVCSPTKNVDSRFAGYLLKDPAMISLFKKRSQGLVSDTWNLKYEKFAQIPCCIPSLTEQKKITEILSGIDLLLNVINKKIEKEILLFLSMQNELLRSQSYIHLKKGKLSDYLIDIVGGGTPSRNESKFWGGDIPWASVKDLSSKKINKTQENITLDGLNRSASNLIPSGIPILSTRMAVGKCALFNMPVAINQDLKALFPDENILDKLFLFYFLVSKENKLQSLGTGSTVKGIRVEDIKDLSISIPSKNEQKKIANLLDEKNNFIELLIKKRKKIIFLKNSLSNDLLNGTKRVKI